MKKLILLSLIVTALVLSLTSTAFAYDRVVGCAVDYYGNPWTWGGTVLCYRELAFPGPILVGSGSLDANGCFEVFIGNGPAVNCYIQYNAGPAGTPATDTCSVPRDSNYPPVPYDCGTVNTDTGPNAVNLSGFGAVGMPAGTLVLALSVVLMGVTVWLRRR